MRLLESLRHAIRGLRLVYREERNFRFQLGVGVIVLILMMILPIRSAERIVLVLLIFVVLGLELLNSALEWLLDILKPRLHDQVAIVKDIMAALVLLAAIGAAVIGLMIFWPYIREL